MAVNRDQLMSQGRKRLTPEERALWSRVTRDAVPIQKSVTRQVLAPTSKSDNDGSRNVTAPESYTAPEFYIGQRAGGAATSSFQPAPGPADYLNQTALRMDHHTHKRMRQGKLRPEARIDLHGMTLAVAQPELTRFVLSCQQSGRRLILVITGKGRGDYGPLPIRPGALRHLVPVWLGQAPLNHVVQQITQAHYRHGGEGAYYVYLRR